MAENNILQMEPNRVMTRQFTNTEYTIRIARPITSPDDFAEELMALASAQENDFVRLDLCCPGGRLDTTILLYEAIKACPCPVVAHVGVECASGGTVLALAADAWELSPFSTFMVHSFSYSPGYDKARAIWEDAEFNKELNETFIREIYTGFLTEELMERVLNKDDVKFNSSQLAERLDAYQEYRDSQGCDNPNCEGCSSDEEFSEQEFNLQDMVSSAVDVGVEKALTKLLKKYNLVEKDKPVPKVKKRPEPAKEISEYLEKPTI